MKAREKNTGKEITILGISKEWGTATYIEDGILRQKNLSGEWEIIDESESVDWDAFRREAAKAALPALINFANSGFEEESVNLDYWTKRAIEWADALIKQLKEE